jgi:Zn-dependent peptidase ImmA (M78 family)/transcriptional regulator with XRE-family HTH domain
MINGDRLRQARDIRSLTQAELGSLVEVDQSTIAYIENERLSPSDELLSRLASATGFPVAFFEDETVDDFPLGSLLLFRGRASMTARQEAQAHQYARALYQCLMQLRQRVNPIPLRLPQIEDTPAKAAEITRAALGLSPNKPIADLTYAAESAGILILALPLEIDGIDAFSLWTGPETDQPIVVLLSGPPGDRLRFNLAHELGHLVMHRSMRGDIRLIEKQAQSFAGALLMPEAILDEMPPPLTLTNLAALKRRWRVSMQALTMRAHDLRAITDRQQRYIFAQMASRGWRMHEPSALDVSLERPRAFRQMVEMLYGVPVDFARLAQDVRLPVNLLEDALSVCRGETTELGNIIQFPSSN